MNTGSEDYIRVTREELVLLLIEIQQRGLVWFCIQDQVDWLIDQARIRRATRTEAD